MADLADLIARLEKATGPDRELDARIDAYVCGRDFVKTVDDGETYLSDKVSGSRLKTLDPTAAYTASIDAALTLVPEGWRWSVGVQNVSEHGGTHYDGPYATCWHPTAGPKGSGIAVNSKGATPAIALCTAALKARQVING